MELDDQSVSLDVRDVQAYCGAYNTVSTPLNLPSHRESSEGPPPTILPLFGSVRSYSDDCKTAGRTSAPEPSTSGRSGDCSTVAFCGGPIWALDWCPFQPGNVLHLAVAAHPRARERNIINRTADGPVIIQIWHVPISDSMDGPGSQAALEAAHASMPSQRQGANENATEAGGDGTAAAVGLPRMALGICLEGGVVWDCKWRPGSSGGNERLGVLAAVLGSGEVQLLSVPDPAHPSSAQEAGHQRPGGASALPPGSNIGAAAAAFVRLRPEALVSASAVLGSLPSVAEWLRSSPHDLLLVGCWDGTVALWRVAAARTGTDAATTEGQLRMELLMHMLALDGPVRGLAWAPPEVATAAGDQAHRHLFAAVGHSDKLRIWDTRNAYSPMLEAPLQARWKMGIEWLGDPSGVVIAEDGGVLRWIDLNPFHRTVRMSPNTNIAGGQGTVWDVHSQQGGRRIAYACADGEVAAVGLQRDLPAQPHSVLTGLRWEAGVLSVLGSDSLAARNRLTAGSKAQPRMCLPQEAIHRVRWSCALPQPEGVGGSLNEASPQSSRTGRKRVQAAPDLPALLACGGAAGVLIIVRV